MIDDGMSSHRIKDMILFADHQRDLARQWRMAGVCVQSHLKSTFAHSDCLG
jgi:hypothetical protein